MLKIAIPVDIRAALELALIKSGPRECGGILMAEHTDLNHFTVRNLTVEQPGTITAFIRRLQKAISELTSFFKSTQQNYSKFNYLGEWHSHPLFSINPSATDHASMIQIATDPSVGANFVVLLIFRIVEGSKLEGSAHTYLPSGLVTTSEIVYEEAQHDRSQ